MLSYIKSNLTNLPFSLGKQIAKLPQEFKPGFGKGYKNKRDDIISSQGFNKSELELFVFSRVKFISEYAYNNVPFYHDLYRENGVNPNRLSCFNDILELPIVKKSDLQNVDIEYRSSKRKSRYIVNTGGSSGTPLSFYIEPSSIPHEWAHMHTIWERIGFEPSSLRVVFAGRSDISDVLQYDSARHQLNVNIYSGWEVIAEQLLLKYKHYRPRYLHGYPSAMFDFILWLDKNQHPLLGAFKNSIDAIFLGSEYPSPQLRDKVEILLDARSISWYGHTERAILAGEVEKQSYEPFITYGFTEANNSNGVFSLMSTSYYNLASPFIRYDTEDIISPTFHDGLLIKFNIESGRSGDYILDNSGAKIFLTALIFGRHHKLFDYCSFLQVEQTVAGYAKVYFVRSNHTQIIHPASLFDSLNVNVIFDFCEINEPIRTPSGKVQLLIK
ncbi:phenylacetate-CoA ligase [Vibrio crassostreae]|nr:phenylacetate-CoA ligase [Vibrio crassostreae]TCT83377.1 phenylacetate-CoA ligase [Vibrio crassostreae]TCU03788.1 phenylacetate-CoA ligase [Vibrio crassostreae]TDW09527.1 phenylacetate-CoA ligase [Vibrio crassostreae]CAK2050558.1 phenylacetate-CoA ligase [Vibrio crassostreae]